MKEFAQLITSLDQSNKTNDKVNALKNYFLSANDQDKIWTLALFTHRKPKRTVNTNLLKDWVTEWTGIPEWLFQESYQVVGDLAETISLLVASTDEGYKEVDNLLSYYIKTLISLRDKSIEEKKKRLQSIYKELDPQERFVFTKIMTGGWRVGVSQNLITKALSEAFDIDKSIIAHRLMGNWSPENFTFQELILEESKNDLASRPYPFYLAHPIETQEIQEELNPAEWQAEWKWDGIRGQIIKRNDEVFIWSRGEELVTEKFPELVEMAEKLPNGAVLDGEITAYRNGEPLSFGVLQTRIGRKNITKNLIKKAPVVFICYDIIEHKGKDIRTKALSYRTQLLNQLLLEIDHPILLASQSIEFSDWVELIEIRKKSRSLKTEGLMLKKKNSIYEAGRKRGSWWKWKIAPLTIDGVMIYAQKGHGRRADLYSDYTLAVWNEDELIPFAKAYSGLTDAEMKKVDAFVKKNTKEKFGPVRTVKPELVFEIAFEGIQVSNRHKSGIALRFPRIKRWRQDKPISEANKLTDLQHLLEKYG
ncbi:ATP-dependent DNA ligase [Marivirga tractuosa]|uniref:DNA ligase (ATP) n=1 Tax=Marivirga tractuosa (strain ATCC 23168 / DSM 4126 / NBRC 15989 / NCIMB 1408 / VKM B-1430 / H-43) TaxID=643867 RepID=E4TS21_MARTH|nr:ATP-dependent DNA ligase [Marivirga tractuosa]ADR20772.1 ATP dependent DNA ligase [Marivirga tractuosa DSM 4126]BDD14777.1 ATP-dependent DNA ligase [Marivirga tractuosa]